MRHWFSNGLPKWFVKFYGQKIIQGSSDFIPAMRYAELIDLFPGIVRSKGTVNIYDPNSDFHTRDETGIKTHRNGWIENACMKLFFCETNAKKILDQIKIWLGEH